VALGLRSILGAVSGVPRSVQPLLRPLDGQVIVDGERLPHDRYVAVFANTTGAVNPLIEPFVDDRTRESFHFLAYAVSAREFAIMTPLLARGHLPIAPTAFLHQTSVWRQMLLALVGKAALPSDPRYVNHPAREVDLETDEPFYTIDGEVLPSIDTRLELRLGPALHVATLRRILPIGRTA
jgi:hypothetical protein